MRSKLFVAAGVLCMSLCAGCVTKFGTKNATRVYRTLEDQGQAYLFCERLRSDKTYVLQFEKFEGDAEFLLQGTVTLYSSDGKIRHKEIVNKTTILPEIAVVTIEHSDSYNACRGKNLLCVEGDLAKYVSKERAWRFVPVAK